MDHVMRRGHFVDVLKTVFAGFLGIRRRADHDAQTGRIRPGHIVAAGIIGAALFITTLLVVVRVVLS